MIATMYLVSLTLNNFKNYAQWEAEFCSNVNCVVGGNGLGKTNLLDAIYYLSFGKSCLNPIDSLNIRQGEDYFAIHGNYQMEGERVMVSCIERKGQPKQLRWNKKTYKTLGEHIGRIPLVMVSPYDQLLIQGGGEVRRKFVDGVVSQTDRGYLTHLLQYQKAVEQRNHLLKQFYEDRYWDEAAIAVWDEQLVRHGQVIYEGRKAFMEEFTPLFADYYAWLTDGSEAGVMEYEGHADVPLQQQLEQARPNDRYATFTTVGPHKDDWVLRIGEQQVKRFGSQGQQKTFVLALKLAQFEYMFRRGGVKPILLLDDVFDKLDMNRVSQLFRLVGGDRFGQVFLTDTQPGRVQKLMSDIPNVEYKVFDIK